jgi:two-component system chemotaxis response regulator CheB
VLPYVLTRAGRLAARCPIDGEQIEPGRIYVAPPDRHLLVEDTVMRLSHDLPDHGHRPAVDVLFCSAAHSFGPRAIGVVLSGNQRDGTAGLATIVSLGGEALVQDPAEARFGGMPRSAIDRVPSAQVLPAHELGRVLVQLVQGETPPPPRSGLHPGSPERALVASEDRGETSINPQLDRRTPAMDRPGGRPPPPGG